MTYFLLLLGIGCAALAWPKKGRPGRIAQASVRRKRNQGCSVFEIQASGVVRATPQQTWAVLTDYGRLPEFVPGLQCSTLLSRCGDAVLLEQWGSIGFLFVRQSIHLIVRVTEHPFSGLDVALIRGDMQHYASHWELLPLDAGTATRLAYRGSMEPNFYVPRLLGRMQVQAEVRNMLAAVVAEVERRS